MLQRLCFILPLYLAFTIVLAHNIVPHHHDHELEATQHHHHHHDNTRHHDEDENKDNNISYGFEFFHHTGSTIQFISSQFPIVKTLGSFQVITFIPLSLFDVRPCESPHTPVCFSPQKRVYSFLFSPQTFLRAPPYIG